MSEDSVFARQTWACHIKMRCSTRVDCSLEKPSSISSSTVKPLDSNFDQQKYSAQARFASTFEDHC